VVRRAKRLSRDGVLPEALELNTRNRTRSEEQRQ
jgi:hypothetical protein